MEVFLCQFLKEEYSDQRKEAVKPKTKFVL